MIELTAEMLNAYAAGASSAAGVPVEASAVGLAAVLAIVERDHFVLPKIRGFLERNPHQFVRHADPRFGSFFGGSCSAEIEGTVCGFPEAFHRPAPPP